MQNSGSPRRGMDAAPLGIRPRSTIGSSAPPGSIHELTERSAGSALPMPLVGRSRRPSRPSFTRCRPRFRQTDPPCGGSVPSFTCRQRRLSGHGQHLTDPSTSDVNSIMLGVVHSPDGRRSRDAGTADVSPLSGRLHRPRFRSIGLFRGSGVSLPCHRPFSAGLRPCAHCMSAALRHPCLRLLPQPGDMAGTPPSWLLTHKLPGRTPIHVRRRRDSSCRAAARSRRSRTARQASVSGGVSTAIRSSSRWSSAWSVA